MSEEAFEREYGCTEQEWLGWMPQATGGRAQPGPAPRCLHVTLSRGRLLLQWQPLPERRIALMRLPRLQVRFRFESVDQEERERFLRHFDLHLQRGGG